MNKQIINFSTYHQLRIHCLKQVRQTNILLLFADLFLRFCCSLQKHSSTAEFLFRTNKTKCVCFLQQKEAFALAFPKSRWWQSASPAFWSHESLDRRWSMPVLSSKRWIWPFLRESKCPAKDPCPQALFFCGTQQKSATQNNVHQDYTLSNKLNGSSIQSSLEMHCKSSQSELFQILGESKIFSTLNLVKIKLVQRILSIIDAKHDCVSRFFSVSFETREEKVNIDKNTTQKSHYHLFLSNKQNKAKGNKTKLSVPFDKMYRKKNMSSAYGTSSIKRRTESLSFPISDYEKVRKTRKNKKKKIIQTIFVLFEQKIDVCVLRIGRDLHHTNNPSFVFFFRTEITKM